MHSMSKGILIFGLILATCMAGGQSQSAPPADAQLAALVKQQFGSTFTLPEKFPTPLIVADFDGDGVEDIAIVAGSKEPIPDSLEFKYQVFDPYNAYFGLENPAISSTFSATDPTRNHDLLVIFGAGAEGWKAATPKAKFVLINVPFDTISVGRMLLKKKKPAVNVIKTNEKDIMESAVYWNGKKWKWEPGNMAN
jgi:hypothetical protein